MSLIIRLSAENHMATLSTQSRPQTPPGSVAEAAGGEQMLLGETQGADRSRGQSTHFSPHLARLEGPPGHTPCMSCSCQPVHMASTRWGHGVHEGGVTATMENAPKVLRGRESRCGFPACYWDAVNPGRQPWEPEIWGGGALIATGCFSTTKSSSSKH